jgi:hypothetical protein
VLTFIETRLFSRLREDYLTDGEYARLQSVLIDAPEQGALIRGSGGVRKMRWSQPGRGKSGGIRVIYYAKVHEELIYMLTLYAKNEASSIAAHVLRQIREEIDAQE